MDLISFVFTIRLQSMSMSWLIGLHVSSTNDTLRLHDERAREGEDERKRHTLTQVYAFTTNGDQIGPFALCALGCVGDTVHRL